MRAPLPLSIAAIAGIHAMVLFSCEATAQGPTVAVEEAAVAFPGHEFDAGRARGNIELQVVAEGAASSGGGAAHGGGRGALSTSFWFGWQALPLDEVTFFYGPLDQRRGLILDLESELVGATELSADGGLRTAWSVTEVASLVLGPVTLAQRLAYQRPTRLSDRSWASQQRVLSLGGCLEVPAIARAERFDVFDLAVTVDLLSRDGRHHGMSAELRAGFFSVHWGPSLARTELSLLVVQARIDEHVLALGEEDARRGAGFLRMLAEVASLSGVRLSPRWQLGARVGVAVNDSMVLTLEGESLAPTEEEGEALMSALWALDFTFNASAPVPFVPHWSWGQRSQPATGNGFAVGLLSFERIDPTGLALDVGGQLAAQLSWSWGDRWTVGAEGVLILAYRQGHASGESLPAAVPEVGEVFLMGRIAADVAYRVGSVVWLRASAFAEHSERTAERGFPEGESPPDPEAFGDVIGVILWEEGSRIAGSFDGTVTYHRCCGVCIDPEVTIHRITESHFEVYLEPLDEMLPHHRPLE